MSAFAPLIFPISRSVLWDRTTCENPRYVRSKDIIPPIYLSPSSIKSLLDNCLNASVNGESVLNLRLCVQEIADIGKSTSLSLFNQSPWRTILGTNSYVMEIESESKIHDSDNKSAFGKDLESSLNIPISVRQSMGDNLLFEKEETL